jgi:hypothetical protein
MKAADVETIIVDMTAIPPEYQRRIVMLKRMIVRMANIKDGAIRVTLDKPNVSIAIR